MSNIVEFKPKQEPHKDFYCSLNRALLTVQYMVMVTGDKDRARELLEAITNGNELSRRVILPGEFREEVEEVDTAATYRKVLGVED